MHIVPLCCHTCRYVSHQDRSPFQADSLFSPDDCVLSDVSLSDALDRRDFNLDRRDLNLDRRDFNDRKEFNLNEKHYTDDKQVLITVVFKMIKTSMLQYGMEREYGEKQNYGSNLSCNSLHSDGDSYPNSPINGENKKHQNSRNENSKDTQVL